MTPVLPVRALEVEIRRALAESSSLVLTAETGSGKTTQVPQILLEGGAIEGEILVLEPRRLAARLVAERVAHEVAERRRSSASAPMRGATAPGGVVGFQTRFERAWSRETRIGFLTEGVYLRRLEREATLAGVGAVILDEFHERSTLADLALGITERIQRGPRPDLKLIVMSATLDAERLAARLGARHLHAEGRCHPVDISFRAAESGVPPWEMAARAMIELLDAGELLGDALVFMPGAEEIDRSVDAIGAALRSRGERAFVTGLHGGMSPQRQDEALRPRSERRVIVATNVAQTSITIDGIRTVIDSGTARVHRHDPRRALDALVLEPISRAAAEQRAGRAGRTAPGRCIRLWSEQDHARRPAFDSPEVLRADLSEPLLTLAALLPGGVSDAERFEWIDPPGTESVALAKTLLLRLGCIDEAGAITEMGRRAAALPLHPRLARAMIEAARLGCVERSAAWCAIAAGRPLVDERDPGSRAALLSLLQKGEAPSDMLVRERLLRTPPSSARVNHAALAEARRACEQLTRLVADSNKAGVRRSDGASRGSTGNTPAIKAPIAGRSTSTDALHGAATEREVALSLLAGFPDFVAWRPDRQKPHALVAGRRKVELDRETLVRGEGFLLALGARAHPRDPSTQLLSLLVPLERAWLEAAMPQRFARPIEERWNPETKAVESIEEVCFDGTPIEMILRPARDLGAAATILARRIALGEVDLPLWDEKVEQWIARVRCVAEWFPQRSLLAYDDEDLAVIRSEIVHGATRASQLADRHCLDAVRGALAHDDAMFVERMAPAEIPLPNGRRLRLTYQPGQPPRGGARIQDLFDLRATPTVAGGRIAVLIEILAPSQRPLQVTSDLPGFFERLYPQIKPELKRRYPKHEWR